MNPRPSLPGPDDTTAPPDLLDSQSFPPGAADFDDLARADRIFAAVLDLEPRARPAYLDVVCAGSPGLRQLVESLLESAQTPDDLLHSGGAFDLASAMGPEDDPATDSDAFGGRYRALEEIGRGGMGVVYRAERADGQFEQEVALKVIHRGAGKHAAARFVRERQILAGLAHPRIARLLDGGVTPSGQPYLVMELVEGRTIDRWCREEEPTLEQRIELMEQVCGAVQAAHQHLVVHRDLKPSNILVTDEGEVKLLDFGIAKLLEGAAADDPGVTHTGGQVMTPQYASPEQYRGDAITVASDVYQLGLVAYEVLSGRRPFELADVSPVEAVRRICVEPPEAPSLGAASRERRRALAGDLDAIVLQALHKDPAQRYRSADQMRRDLVRHRSGRPVTARPDRLGYRLGKFARRHRWPLAATTAVVALLVGLVTTFTLRLAEERDRTREQAIEAETERRHAEEVASFLQGLFEGSNPAANSQGETLTIREVLDRGAERVEQLADQPATQARLMATIGHIDHVLGNWERARDLLWRSLELREREPETDPSDLAQTLDRLASIEMKLGDPEASFGLLERALGHYREDPEGAERLPGIYHRLSASRQYQGRWVEAEGFGRRAVELASEHDLPALDQARYLDGLANSLDEMGRVEEAREIYRQILALDSSDLGRWHPMRAGTLSNLASSHARGGEFGAALPLFAEALEVLERSLGPEHPHWAILTSNLATSHLELGRYDEAETAYQAALDLRLRIFGENHLEVTRSWVDLGKTSLVRGEPGKAVEQLQRALVSLEMSLTADHPFRGSALVFLGQAFAQLDLPTQAEEVLRESIEVFEGAYGPEHPILGDSLYHLAELARRQGDRVSAIELLERLVAIRRSAEGVSPEALRQAEEALEDLTSSSLL